MPRGAHPTGRRGRPPPRCQRTHRASKAPREVQARLNREANKGRHRNAAMLDLGVAEPGDVLLGGLADVHRVPIAEDGVKLRQALEASLVADLLGVAPRLVPSEVRPTQIRTGGVSLERHRRRRGAGRHRRRGKVRRAATASFGGGLIREGRKWCGDEICFLKTTE